MAMAEYMSVTVGPIFDTISMATSPAALWTGSYLFSYLTKTICRLLVESGVPEEDILVPYYSASQDFDPANEGVGLFHDRIVFRAEGYAPASFRKIREQTIRHVAETFQVEEAYLQEYLMIAAAMCDVEHPILDTSKIMDSLELAHPILQSRTNDPLLSLFIGEENYGNENIKHLPLTKSFTNWQLRASADRLKSIPDIASAGCPAVMKKHKYYAIVRADGDRMSNIIKQLKENTIREFSRDCIHYCSAIAGKVRSYGGVAIYSGGDDLLAIMPCENATGETVFDFIQEANQIFAKSFPQEKYHANVSLSFGVTICYHKFPLYEALEDSQNMLFGIAKSQRDCTAIHLQKHAGQSEGLVIPNAALDRFVTFFKDSMAKADSEWLHSIHHQLCSARHMCNAAGADEIRIRNFFVNQFDSFSHQGNSYIHQELPRFYHQLKTGLGIRSIGDTQDTDDIDTLCYILRMFKFFTEKGGETE